MSAFIDDMNKGQDAQRVQGAKGAWQEALPLPGKTDGLVGLFVETCRGADTCLMGGKLAVTLASSDPNVVQLAIAFLFQLRDVRGGKGERRLFFDLFCKVVTVYPKTACDLVGLFPEYGRYKDLVDMWIHTNSRRGHMHFDQLRKTLVGKYAEALRRDAKVVAGRVLDSDGVPVVTADAPTLAFAAKWLPGSKRTSNSTPTPAHAFRRAVRDQLFGADPQASKKLRYLVSACNAELGVVETLMSTRQWDAISPSKLTSGALHKYRLALLYEHKKSGGQLRGKDPVRIALREKVLTAAIKGTVNAGTLDAHQIVQKCMGSKSGWSYTFNVSPSEAVVLDGQWKSILATVKAQMVDFAAQLGSEGAAGKKMDLNLGNIVPMVDVSGSMTGTPMEVAIAMGLVLSELAADPFRHHVLTFSTNPTWHVTSQPTLIDKVRALAAAPWSGSTNFLKAFDKILERLEAAMVSTREWIEPPALITFSDMQFDQAGNTYNYGSSWDTYDTMTRNFEDLVRRMRQSGITVPTTVTMPLQIFWNINSVTTGLAAGVDKKGVILLSGYNQSLLKLILKGQLPVGAGANAAPSVTPKDTFLAAMADTRYDQVRAVLDASREKALVGYHWTTAEEPMDTSEEGGGSKEPMDSEEMLTVTE